MMKLSTTKAGRALAGVCFGALLLVGCASDGDGEQTSAAAGDAVEATDDDSGRTLATPSEESVVTEDSSTEDDDGQVTPDEDTESTSAETAEPEEVEDGDVDSDTSSSDADEQATDSAGEATDTDDGDGAQSEPESTSSTTAAPLPQEEDEIPVTAPVNEDGLEPGAGTPDFEDALEAQAMSSPCDLFSEADLAALVRTSAESAGLFGELPPGLGDGSDLSFAVSSSSETSCEWFSDSYIWFIGVTWEAADPTFVDTIFENQTSFGTGYQAAILDDTSSQIVVADLLLRVTNLVPGNTATSADGEVTRDLVEAIGSLLAS